MKVRALKLGYCGDKRRREGDEFIIDPKLFSEKWMEKVDEAADEPEAQVVAQPVKKKVKAPVVKEPVSTGDSDVI